MVDFFKTEKYIEQVAILCKAWYNDFVGLYKISPYSNFGGRYVLQDARFSKH